MSLPMTTRQREWKKRVEDCLSSGLSQTEYCQRHGIKLKRFYSWKHRLNQLGLLDRQPVTQGEFLPVVISQNTEQLPCTRAVLLKIGKVDIVMTHETDDNLLLRALALLEARS
jgi:hypothetical protein